MLAVTDKWRSKQSIYIPLLLWSVKPEDKVNSRIVLPRALIGLDYAQRFFSVPYETSIDHAAFLHFQGQPLSWEAKARKIISNLTCYKKMEGKQFKGKELRDIQTYAASGEKLDFEHERICGDVFNEGDLFRTKKA